VNKSKQKILAIIPARGGSKGIPGKNIKIIAGKPLLAWTIETALQSKSIQRVIVSTDNDTIGKIAKEYGAEVPFMRPKKYAQDSTSDMPVYLHTLNWLAENENYIPEIIVWLRPTSPLRTAEDIENAIKIMCNENPDWVRSVCKVEHHPYWMYEIIDNKLKPVTKGINISDYLQRQLLPDVYRLNGAIDIVKATTIISDKLMYSGEMTPYIMPYDRSIDIDTILDFKLAEQLLLKK